MSERFGRDSQECREARRAIQDRLDGPVGTERERALRAHLDRCAGCREHRQGLLEVQRLLRSIPEHRLPDQALEEVWEITVRAERKQRRSRVWALDWRPVAAAAALVIALLGIWIVGRRDGRPDGIVGTGAPVIASDAERTDAEREIRLVLNLTADALRRTERAALRSVLADEVSPALRRIPVRFPDLPAPKERRTGT